MTTEQATKPAFTLIDPTALQVDREALAAQVNPLVAKARALTIASQEDDEAAQRDMVALKAADKFVEAVYKKPKSILHGAHEDVCAEEKGWRDPINEALKITFDKHCDWEAKARAEAEAERKRLEEEARKAEEEAQLQDALRAEAAGDQAGAREIMEKPPERPIVRVEAAVTKVAGVGKAREFPSVEVFDFKALVKHVAAECEKNPGLLKVIEAAMPALKQMARAQGADLTLPGVRVVFKKSMNVRTA